MHTPLLQPATAFAKLQTFEQLLQWLGSEVRFVSQPSAIRALQLSNPVLQAVIEQLPPEQAPIALAGAQAFPQVPQLCMLVPRLVSQPFETRVSQLPKPAVHVIEQSPPVQDAVPLVELQTLLQTPQLAASVVRLASQPFENLVSQSENPALQAPAGIVQAEFRHVAVALAATQAVPQVPQFKASFVVVVSQPSPTLPLQLPKPAAQVILQTPAEQLGVPWELLQAAPQVPQLVALLLVSASQPFAAFAPLISQFWKLPLQDVIVQVPATHAPTALAGAHTEPHALQLFVSVLRLTSQPSERSPLQSAKPASQVLIPQAPNVHLAVA